VKYLREVTPDQIRDITENQFGNWIDLTNAEVRIDQINADRRLVDQNLELRRAVVGALGGLTAHERHLEMGFDAGQQLSRVERFNQVIVSAGCDSFNPAFLASACREHDQWNILQQGIGANRA